MLLIRVALFRQNIFKGTEFKVLSFSDIWLNQLVYQLGTTFKFIKILFIKSFFKYFNYFIKSLLKILVIKIRKDYKSKNPVFTKNMDIPSLFLKFSRETFFLTSSNFFFCHFKIGNSTPPCKSSYLRPARKMAGFFIFIGVNPLALNPSDVSRMALLFGPKFLIIFHHHGNNISLLLIDIFIYFCISHCIMIFRIV